MGNGRVADRSPDVIAVFLEGLALELRVVISDDTLRYPEPANNSLDELDGRQGSDCPHLFHLHALRELVYHHHQVLVTTDLPRKFPNDVQPPGLKGQ
jgi:hypothetical protein